MSTFVFINSYTGKSKEKQKPFNKVSIAAIDEDNGSRVYDLFTDGGTPLPNQDQLRFGDVVEPSYRDSDYPGGRPSLVGLTVVVSSPYFSH